MGTLVSLQQRAPEWALARLNRVTGLTFSRLPVSLLALQEPTTAADDSHEKELRLVEAQPKFA
jgi:hypothetical protein